MYVGFGSILSLHVCLRITLPYSPLSVSLSLSVHQGSLICSRTDGALYPHENSDSVCMEISRCWRYGEEDFRVHRHTFTGSTKHFGPLKGLRRPQQLREIMFQLQLQLPQFPFWASASQQ